VFAIIAACLFPLWPDWIRLGVYYLSVAGIALFGLLLGVALGKLNTVKILIDFLSARTVLFGAIYVCTMGRHKLWILPNLTEDCGFFESFQPWYTYEYCAPAAESSAAKKPKKDKKKKKGTSSNASN
jgi:translocation protein SEC62